MDFATRISFPLTGNRSSISLSPFWYRFFITLPVAIIVARQIVNVATMTKNSILSPERVTNKFVR